MSNSVAIQKYKVEVLEIKQRVDEVLMAYARSEGILFGDHSENTVERERQFTNSLRVHKDQLVKNLLHHIDRLNKITL